MSPTNQTAEAGQLQNVAGISTPVGVRLPSANGAQVNRHNVNVVPSNSRSSSTPPHIPVQISSTQRSISEHRRLFSMPPCTSGRKAKGKKTGKERRLSCTLKFYALSKMDTSKPPLQVRERTMLRNAGLGESTIQLFLDMNSVQCHQCIIERFPKLSECGYEMLLYQRGESAGFIKIEGSYTPMSLKDAAGNAKIYLRPLQKDLDVSENLEAMKVCNYYIFKRDCFVLCDMSSEHVYYEVFLDSGW